MKKFFTLIAAMVMTVCANAATEVDYSIDWTKQTAFNFWKAEIVTNLTVDTDGLHITNETATTNYWDLQLWIADQATLKTGEMYKVTVVAKAEGTDNATIRYKLGDWSNGSTGQFVVTSGEGYKEFSFDCEAKTGNNGLLVQFGDFIGTVSFKSVTISHEAGAPTPIEGSLKITTPNAQSEGYGWKIFYALPEALKAGTQYKLTMDAKADTPFDMQLVPYYSDDIANYGVGPVDVTTEWKSFEFYFTNEFTETELQWFIGHLNGTCYFDNIVLTEVGQSTNLIQNGDFSINSVKGWRKNSWHGDLSFSVAEDVNCTTAIKTVATKVQNDGVMYNLAGQRVNNAKGIVIVNGKKVAVK